MTRTDGRTLLGALLALCLIASVAIVAGLHAGGIEGVRADGCDEHHRCSTSTPAPTRTATATPPATSTPSATFTATSTNTATATPTATFTNTATSTPTPTATSTATNTPTATPTGPVFSDLALSANTNRIGAGLDNVPVADVPASVLSAGGAPSSNKLSNVSLKDSSLSSVSLSSVSLSSVSLSSVAAVASSLSSVSLSSVPLDTPGGWDAILQGTALEGIPLQSVTLADVLALNPAPASLSSVTLADLDLANSSLSSVRLLSLSLSSVSLSSVPLPSGASDWCQVLADAGFDCASIGKDANTIGSMTLLELDIAGAPIDKLGIDSASLSSVNIAGTSLSSVSLSSVSLSSVSLSSVTLGDISLSSVDTEGASLSSVSLSSVPVPSGYATWCDALAADGYDCATYGIDNNSTLFQVVSAGIPIQGTSLSSVSLSSVLIASISPSALKLADISLSSVAINGTSLSSVSLSSVNIAGTFLANISLSSVPVPGDVVNCSLVDCSTATLGDAALAGAILPNATLGALGSYGDGTVQDVLNLLGANPTSLTYFLNFLYGDGTIGDISQKLGDTTIGQILIALLSHTDYPWEDVSLDALAGADLPPADNANVLHYTANFTYTGGSSATTVNVAVTLPNQFHYIKGTAKISVDGAPATSIPDPTASGNTITWTLPAFPANAHVTITFDVRPGLTLGPGNVSSLTVSDEGHPPASIDGQAPVTVIENFEPNNDPNNATDIGPDRLIISHVGSPGDRDFFRIPGGLPVGSRIEILLSHQAQDNDVALFRPQASQLRPPSGASLSSVPLTDAPDAVGPTTDPPDQVLQDLNLPQGLSLSSVSANRGTTDDNVSTVSLGDSGSFTIEVSGYQKSATDQPYTLREKVTPPPAAPQCAARVFPDAGQGVAGTAPASVASNTNTLFLVDEKRLGDLYGSAKAAEVVAALNALAARSDLGVVGAVIPVEGNPAVANAYDAWDANPCSPEAANAVVAAINAMVDGYRANLTGLQNIVLTGSDDVIPFARVPDLTQVSNESEYTPDILAVNGQEALLGAFVTSNVLSDNTYGAFHPIPWLDHQLSIPEVGVGRLVETPDQITSQINEYIGFNGRLDPTTALTTGYDFLSDGAAQVADSVDGIVGAANDQRLINDTWTSADLASHFNESTPVPGIASINAHYDHHRLLPAAGNTANNESDLFTTQNILRGPASPQILPARVLFSMGCHSALNVPDAFAGLPSAEQAQLLLDWPQAYADQGAAVYVGNTGYGYGDTDTVAYSEELMAKFSQRLGGTLTIGQALTFAKQDYYGSLAQYETYDEKVLSETVFYGLPMYRIGQAQPNLSATAGGPTTARATTAGVTPTATPFTTDPVTGLDAVPLDLAPTFTKTVQAETGNSYYTIDGEAEVNSGRPIEPKTGMDLPPDANGKTAHGIIITGMSSSDQSNFHAAFSKPADDTSVDAPPSLDPFPASLHTLTSFYAEDGLHQRAVFTPGQFIPDPSATPGVGTQRLFNSITAEALYSDSADVTAPTILQAHATGVGTVVSFFVEAQDDIPDNVARVFVLYKAPSANDWVRVELVHTSGTDRWTSSAIADPGLSYLVYAVDTAGNSGVSSNKGELYRVESLGTPTGLTIDVTGTPAGSGWLSSAQVSISGNAGATYQYSVDNGPLQDYTGPFALAGDGIHFVFAAGSDGSQGSASAAVDAGNPLITINAPADGAVFTTGDAVSAAYFCADAGSGVQSCSGSAPDGGAIDTATFGKKTFTVNATDVVGHTSSLTRTYYVSSCGAPNDSADADADGITNAAEFTLGTDPCNPDTDGDGLSDAAEVNTYHTDPLKPDTDADGCGDGKELQLVPPTSPTDPWDFYSVPVPALFAAANPTATFKDRFVTSPDAQAIFAYFQRGAKTGTTLYEQDLNLNGIKDGVEYDRTALGAGQSGPPDGVISAADAQTAFAQFKHHYAC